MSLSVKSSLAEAMESKGTSRRPLVVAMRMVSPEMPSMMPETCLAPSIGSSKRTRASWPAQSAKSDLRVSGRSMPGELTSSR
jgi:hypothetical protein